MKVCVIGPRKVPEHIGGIETVYTNLYPTLLKINRGVEITLLTRSKHRETSYRYLGTTVIPLSADFGAGFENFLGSLKALFYAKRQVKPDIVHLHGIGPGVFAPIAKLLGFKVVTTHHSTDYDRPKWRWYARALLRTGEVFTCLFSDRVVCVSQALKDDVDARLPFRRKVRRTIPNAAPTVVSAESSSVLGRLNLTSGSYLLCVGRIEETKRFDIAVKAYQASSLDIPLVIVGDTQEDRAYAESLVADTASDIRLVGPIFGEELADLYRNCTLLVNASKMEGYCLVVAEAIMQGARILLSDIPVHREFGLDSASYFPVDDVAVLTDKLNAPDYNVYESHRCRSKLEAWSWDAAALDYFGLYCELIQKGPIQ